MSQFVAKAPGTFVLFGEHAVLHGGLAIVCAANQFIQVTLTPRKDQRLTIQSALGVYEADLKALQVEKPFTFVLNAIARCAAKCTSGFDLHIESQFSSTVGLGSSAAVTVATVKVLKQFVGEALSPRALFDESLQVIRDVQGCGSGADVAASCFGGMVAYRAEPCVIEALPGPYPCLGLFYSGSKTPTPAVIRWVEEKFADSPEQLAAIYQAINAIAERAKLALQQADQAALIQCFQEQQQQMQALGVCNQALAQLLEQLQQQPGVLAAKISGSGLGDCLVALLNSATADFPSLPYIPVQISTSH